MRRSYWIYSAGCALAWAVVLIVVATSKHRDVRGVLDVFGGFAIAWVSGTIARYVYPPPRKWLDGAASDPVR